MKLKSMQALKRYTKLFSKGSNKSPMASRESVQYAECERKSKNMADGCCSLSCLPMNMSEVKELTQVFGYFDADEDGKISMADLSTVLNSLGEEMSEKEVKAMMAEVDSDGDGYIDLQDFLRLNKRAMGSEAEAELLEAFRLFDMEKGGFITPLGLHQMMVRLGHERISLDDCCQMIKRVDLDGDGVVNFHEFKQMMSISACSDAR